MYTCACTEEHVPEKMNAAFVEKYGRSPRHFSVQECACHVGKAQIAPKVHKYVYLLGIREYKLFIASRVNAQGAG